MANLHSDDALREGAGLIVYEMGAMQEALKRRPTHDAKETRAVRRLCTDAWLVHVRNLLDFLFPRPTARPEDVLASDYDTEWSAPEDLRIGGRPVEELRRHIDKLVSHVTYERRRIIEDLRSQGDRWPTQLTDDIEECMRRFLATLPAGQGAWFAEAFITPHRSSQLE